MSELKPCPFCGGEAELRDDNGNEYPYTVECVECGATTSQYRHADTPYGAIEAWNTSAERTCHAVPHGYCIANGEVSCCRCWSCSECSYGWHVSDYDRQYRYCPNCGAKVIEE